MKTKILLLILCLSFLNTYSAGITTVLPPPGFKSPVFDVRFVWNKVLGISSYRIKIGTDTFLTNIIKDTVVSQSSAQIRLSNSSGTVYWKVSTAGGSAFIESASTRLDFFSPAQNPNLLVWLAADSNVVLQPDSTIDAWNNIIPNGLNAVQPTAGFKPLLINNVLELNNKRTVRFDGLDDFLNISSGGEVGSCYFLCNWRGGSSFPSYNGLITNLNIAALDDYIMIGDPGTSRLFGAGYFGTNSFVNNFLENNLAPLNNYKVVSGRRNNVIKSFPAFNLGKEPGFNATWNGDFSEVIISKKSSVTESDSLHQYFYNKYAPPVSLGPDTIFGTSFSDPITLSVLNRFTSYVWSTGSTINSATLPAAGRYSLKTIDIFGRESEDDIEVYPYKRLNNITAYLCQGDSLVVNLGISGPFTFLWSTGSAANTIVIKNSGTYWVRITDFKGQFLYDTIHVVVDNPSLSPTPDAFSNLQMCLNEKLFVTTASGFNSISWSTGSTNTFISVNVSGTYHIYAQTTAGCILRDTFNITIAGEAPSADFITSLLCEDTPASFTDLSTFPPGNSVVAWNWAFGDGHSATSSSPSNTYENVGTYFTSLKVTTNVGCSDSIVKLITVRKRPVADFFNLLSCSGNPTTFVDNSIANADSLLSWAWNFGGLGSSTEKNPKFNFPAASVYNTLLKVTNSFGCEDTTTRQTVVNPSPVADFRADSTCQGSNTIFTNLSTVAPPFQITNYFWEYGDESQSIQVSQPHLYATYGQYDVRLSIRSSNQCVDTVEKTVRVFANPNVDFTISNTQCTGKEVQFTDASSTPDGAVLNDWKWFFSGQGTSALQDPKFTFNTQGNYTIQLTARTSAGCSGSKFRSVAITSPPTVNFSFTPNYGPPDLLVSYTNSSPSNGNYIWDYGDGSPTYFGYTPPPHTYTVRGTYPIKLLATDFKGCSDSLVKDILVDDAVIDGVMVTVNIIANGDFYKVVATVLNNSNIEITSLGLTIRLANGSEIREIWTGSLKPGNSVVYPFTGELRYNADGDIPVICATIESININALESDLSNNTTCEEITVGPFEVLTVYPNPSKDNVNFGVMLPNNGEVEITLYDMMGKLLYAVKYNGVTGYNNLRMPLLVLNGAVYIAEIKFNEALIRRKVMRTDK